ncbi:MAG TPA: cupin domain-containing protein [Coriobacteriia bacterium]
MIIRRDSVSAFDFGGLGIQDYTAGLDSGSSFAVIAVSPGATHAEAWSRRSDKYYYVVSGTIEFTDSGETCALGAGDFCLARQGDRFSYRNTSGDAATILLFHTPSFDPDSEVFADSPEG